MGDFPVGVNIDVAISARLVSKYFMNQRLDLNQISMDFINMDITYNAPSKCKCKKLPIENSIGP